MRIALAQLTSGADPDGNLELISTSVKEAATAGAEVVVFPEATMTCFGVPLRPVAQRLDGPWAKAVASVARAHGVVVVAGMFEPSTDGRVFNTLLVTGGGHHLGYRKIHLYDAFGFAESATVAPGSRPLALDIAGVRVGIATCYDVRFPELFRALGADVTLLGASWGAGAGKREQWELLVRARALDSGAWVAACGQADPAASGIAPHPKAPTGIGYSLVADPYGVVYASAGTAPELLVADVDPVVARKSRDAIGQLANRRLP
jgi:predicted amidohydrolase